MYAFIIILLVLASLLMCFVVLIQESKGGGLAADYSSNNQILGAPKTTNFVEKLTWGLAIAMVCLSVVSVAVLPSTGRQQSVIMDQATEQQAVNPNNLPGMPSTPAEPVEEAPAQ